MKSALARALTLAVIATPLVVVAGPAHAGTDSPGCVTHREFRSVRKGMTKARVQAVFDTAGRRAAYSSAGGFVFEIRTYKVCRSPYSTVSIGYQKGPGETLRLTSKVGVFV